MGIGLDGQQKARKERMLELAGILKEKGKGTNKQLKKLIRLFSMQEGVRLITAQEYLQMFKDVDLVKVFVGSKRWKYNKAAEWELFNVQI